MTTYVLLAAAAVASAIAIPSFNRFAVSRGIIAKMNSRTLHERAVPRGGGIAFALVFALAIFVLWLMDGVSHTMLLAVGVGGAAAATVGFFDDVREIRARTKFLLHVLLAVWMLVVLWRPLYAPVFRDAGLPVQIIGVAALLFVPTWMINLYNFIDGIDGMAISAAVFICAAAITVLLLTDGNQELAFLFALLGASSLSFLFWNMPPARAFMGDAGSIFLGYCFAALILTTVFTRQITPWTWIAILAYYVADTTTTTLCRMFLVKRWYGVHRSHAYQNLARVRQSHGRVLYGVVAYQVCWALPLAIWSALRPDQAIVAATLAVAPAMLWTLRFGPPLSSD